MKTNYILGDVHDDVDSLRAALDFIQADAPEGAIVFDVGDKSMRPYKTEHILPLVGLTKSVAVSLLQRGVLANPMVVLAKIISGEIDGPELNQSRADFLEQKRAHNEPIVREMIESLDATGMRRFSIPGNYDPEMHGLDSADIHKGTSDLFGKKIFGYGGADAHPSHIELLCVAGEIVKYDHNELFGLLQKEQPSTLLMHNPAHGLCDDLYDGKNVGSIAARKYINKRLLDGESLLVLSGHVHEAGPNGNNPRGVRGLQVLEGKDGARCVSINPGNLGRWELVLDPIKLDPVLRPDYGTFARLDTEDDGTPVKLTQYSLQTSERGIGQVRVIGEYNF